MKVGPKHSSFGFFKDDPPSCIVRTAKEEGMTTIRAKFRVTEITRSMAYKSWTKADGSYEHGQQEVRTVHLSPVAGSGDASDENKKFWDATPSGKIEIGCANLEAAEAFELEKEYYVDFTPAEVVVPSE